MSGDDLKTYLDLAEAAALAAGARLAARPEAWQEVTSQKGRDVKVAADVKSEALISSLLTAGSPYPILGEEAGWQGDLVSGGRAWIVDPLDGSANFARAIPLCVVSIALIDNGKPVLGVIYDFNHEDLYTGIVGHGAWLNHAAMTVSDVNAKNKAILMTGFPVARDFSPEALATYAAQLGEWQKVRMIGSAALALAYVACGRADFYREDKTMLWDVAAGCALVEAAGGLVTISDGPLEAPKDVTARTQGLKNV